MLRIFMVLMISNWAFDLMAQINVVDSSKNSISELKERMPIWHSCDSAHFTHQETQICTQENLAQYVYERIELPKRVKKRKLSGRVVVSFVVEKDGQITNVKVLRDIGGGCGKAVKKVVESMPAWLPAVQRGEYVSVQFNFPVNINQ